MRSQLKNERGNFFLSISIKNGKIVTDLYRKPTDRVQYLLPSSCHPNHIFNNIRTLWHLEMSEFEVKGKN